MIVSSRYLDSGIRTFRRFELVSGWASRRRRRGARSTEAELVDFRRRRLSPVFSRRRPSVRRSRSRRRAEEGRIQAASYPGRPRVDGWRCPTVLERSCRGWCWCAGPTVPRSSTDTESFLHLAPRLVCSWYTQTLQSILSPDVGHTTTCHLARLNHTNTAPFKVVEVSFFCTLGIMAYS